MTAYVATTWVNNTTPALSAANLNKLTDELELQASERSVTHSLPTWVNSAPPALTDPVPLNEMERVTSVVAAGLGLSYTVTTWQSGWTPARNAARFNRLEQQVAANRAAIDGAGSNYPASYTNGPLGSNTPLPADSTKTFIINFYGGIGTSWAQSQTALAVREADIGRKFNGIHVNYGAEIRTAEGDIPGWIIGRGQLPCITWEPSNNLAAVNAGTYDSFIDATADHFKQYSPHVVMVRPFREFNLSFLGYGTGQPLIDAWRRVVNRFQARGASNVGFWWTPDEGTDRAGINASWPGDDYVDWSGCDQYNMFLHGQVTPLHAGWAEFWEIVHYGTNCQHDLWGPRKAFVIGETGTHVDPNNIPRKGDWHRNIPAAIRGTVGNQGPMDFLKGISFYDADVSAAEGPDNNFRVDHPTSVPAVYQGWKDMCADSIWAPGPA